jgi:lipopolysaccharide/colanic/teichoic acid biosynthesis glycosyltransferase
MKRLFDIIFATLFFIISLPFLIIFSIIIFLELRSSPIFIQERGLTLDKHRFKILKLRTLKKREKNIEHKTEQDIFLKPSLVKSVSPFSKWLRKTGLDELPQLLNVIIGNMSLVGPRPLMIEDLETMKKLSPEIYGRRSELQSKPGITGLWQLFGNREEGLIGMIALESLYEKVGSISLDIKLIAYTSTVILQAKNSDSIFYKERATATKVQTILDSSSNLKISLNMPDGIARFIIENVEKHEGKYTVEIPQDWWYVSDTIKAGQNKKQTVNIYHIEAKTSSKTKKSALNNF